MARAPRGVVSGCSQRVLRALAREEVNMPRAIWNGQVVAETEEFETVEGNIYFPPDSIRPEFFSMTDAHSVCPWKGIASYYDVTVDGETAKEAAWVYPVTKSPHAKPIEGYVAFWRGAQVEQ